MTLKELIKVLDYDTLVYITARFGVKQIYNGIMTGIPASLMDKKIYAIMPTDFNSLDISIIEAE